MSTSHRATINFQYSIKGNSKYRSFASITTQVHGNTPNDVMKTLREIYPDWENIVILEIEWKK